MNDQMFASMAEQMHPDEEVLASLQARLEAEDAAQRPAPTPLAARRRRVPPARWWIGIAAAAVAVAIMVPAAGRWPVQAGVAGPEAVQPAAGDSDVAYAAVYQAAAAAAARQDTARQWYDCATCATRAEGSAAGAVPAPMPTSSTTQSGWRTNSQVSGIDEGDIVKSDGHSIFVASGQKVAILTPDGASTRQVATIDTSSGEAGKPSSGQYTLQGPVVELDLYGSTLVALVTEYRPTDSKLPTPFPGPATSTMVPFDAALTKALVYDVSDPAGPRYVKSLGQSGGLVTTRLTDGLLYVVTNYTLADSKKLEPDNPKTFVPVLTENDRVAATRAGDIDVMPAPSGPTYTVVSSIDVGARSRVDTQSVLGGTATVFMSTDNVFLASTDYDTSAKDLAKAGAKDLKSGAVTQLARVGTRNGELTLSAQGTIPGTVLNQFALDEYQGDLRVVTSIEGASRKGPWVQRAALFVLDADLKVVGSISSLVSRESVQSVRFAGPVGYVVTFRQMDPLFAVDLTDGTKPRVLSALKIPGFSTYLHPWSEAELLGLGRNATTKGEDLGLKLSMFNTADPVNVTESSVLKVSGDDAEALYDHRAVLVDVADGLIGFAVSDWSSKNVTVSYQVFRYEQGKGFTRAARLSLVRESQGQPTRGLVIGDYLYVVSERSVSAYTTGTFARVARLAVKG